MNYVERHQDYKLGPAEDTRLTSVAAGQSINGLILGLDSDAPFVLRSRALRQKFTTDGNDQAGLNHLLMRWYGPDRNYTSQNLVRQSLIGPYFGQIGNPLPVSPEIIYPQGGEIRVDIKNDGATTITNLTIYFRGVKLFKPGAVKAYTYPPKFALLPFVYPQTVSQLPVTTGAPGTRNVFLGKSDSDFVLQALQAGLPFNATPVFEVFITLKDEDEKPYSNAPVHMDILCGNSAMSSIYPAGTHTHVVPVAGGSNSPGLVYPEIYIPANHVFYFDVSRADAGYGGEVPVDFPLQFIGTKVFLK